MKISISVFIFSITRNYLCNFTSGEKVSPFVLKQSTHLGTNKALIISVGFKRVEIDGGRQCIMETEEQSE